VGLYEAGDHGAAVSVNHGFGCQSAVADLCDASVSYEEIAACDGVLLVHRDERSVLDKN
jgi:hypothetical protein